MDSSARTGDGLTPISTPACAAPSPPLPSSAALSSLVSSASAAISTMARGSAAMRLSSPSLRSTSAIVSSSPPVPDEPHPASLDCSRVPHGGSGRVASGAGGRSGGVGPPRPARSPQGGESGEWVTQLERSPAPGDRYYAGPLGAQSPCGYP